MFLALYLFLPTVNAVFDWLSWWASRALLRHLVGPEQVPEGELPHIGALRLLLHSLLDIVLAAVLLLGVALALPAVLQLWHGLAGLLDWPPVEWWRYLAEARADPFGKGIFVTAMLLSTLLPTAVHLLVIGCCLMLPAPGQSLPAGIAARFHGWLVAPKFSIGRFFALLGIFAATVLSWLLLVMTGIVVVDAAYVFHVPLGACLADLAQLAGQNVGPALPAEAAPHLAPITCQLLLD